MIQPLRIIHRRVFLVFAIVLPGIFIGGLRARRTWPVMAAQPLPIAGASGSVEADGNWRQFHIRLKIFHGEPSESVTRVQLLPQGDLAEPEVLVYWSVAEPKDSSLPDDARLLGKLDPSVSYTLPEMAHGGSFLILYSAARSALLDWTEIGGHL
jgi:hypothetical protein